MSVDGAFTMSGRDCVVTVPRGFDKASDELPSDVSDMPAKP